jgi:hypothetical protein
MNKDKHPIDDFFKESLQDYKVTPSGISRDRFIKAAASTGIKGNALRFRWLNLIIAASLICSLIALYLLLMKDNPSPLYKGVSNSMNYEKKFAKQNKLQITEETSINDKATRQISITTSIKSNSFQTKKDEDNNISGKNSEPTVDNTAGENENIKVSSDLVLKYSDLKNSLDINYNLFPQNDSIRNPSGNGNLFKLIPQPVSLAFLMDNGNKGFDEKTTYGKGPLKSIQSQPCNFTTYLNYSYERILTKNDWNRNQSLGLEGKFQKNRLSLSTGIELSFTDASNKNQVEYNDYLGTYKKLDSLTFSWDEKHYYLLPTYYMSDKTVFDSAVQLDYYQVTKRYELLQIPLILGYDITRRNHFTFGAKTGSAITFYINSRKLADEYSAGMNKVIKLTQLPSDLTRINWYVLANLSTTYEIFRGVIIELDPEIKYRISPANTLAGSGKNAFLFGFRSYLKIKF